MILFPSDKIWALSSAGRASALQAEGHRFEPYSAHHIPYGKKLPEKCKGFQKKSKKNGAYRARTYDPLLVRQMLSQLS